jgi:hypothetical protein
MDPNDNTPQFTDWPREEQPTPEALSVPLPEFVEQVQIGFCTNGRAMQVQLRFRDGEQPDETNLAHILAWYIAQSAGDLIPIAIRSWHAQRAKMLVDAGDPAPEEPPLERA